MSVLLLFFEGGGDGATSSGNGGWLTEEQARAQIKRNRELERAENERRKLVKAKQRELEDIIEEAYAKATGKKVVREALGKAPSLPAAPEATVEVAADVAARLAGVLEDRGRRFAAERRLAAEIQRRVVELERLIQEADVRRQEDDIAAMLLLAAV